MLFFKEQKHNNLSLNALKIQRDTALLARIISFIIIRIHPPPPDLSGTDDVDNDGIAEFCDFCPYDNDNLNRPESCLSSELVNLCEKCFKK